MFNSEEFWRVLLLAIITVSVIFVSFRILANTMAILPPEPTPVPIIRSCMSRRYSLADEVADRFFQDVHLLDPNDVDFSGHSVQRPTGIRFTDKQKANMQVVVVYFQAEKPGTGRYVKGRFNVYLENNVSCRIQFTELEW